MNLELLLSKISFASIAFYFIKYISVIVLTIVSFYVLTKIVIFINHRLSKGYLVKSSAKRKETIVKMIDNLIKYVMAIIGSFALLISLGFDKTTLIAGAGAASVIIGLAGRELITDFINGFFTIVEGYYDVGDYIFVNGHTGNVEKLGIKSTVLRTDKGEEVTIPNSLIEEIVNYNRGEHHLFLTIPTSYEVQLQKSQDTIKNKILPAVEKNNKITKGEYMGVSKLNDSSVDHLIKVTCLPDNRFQVERDVYTLVKQIFDEEQIEIPYNKITIVNE